MLKLYQNLQQPVSSLETTPNQNKITLVLDLDETLVHYSVQQGKGGFLVRPYAK